jgi:hypothetical protein
LKDKVKEIPVFINTEKNAANRKKAGKNNTALLPFINFGMRIYWEI